MQDDLIYDVGMNNGDDTAYYLEEGYRVLAIEANPQLAEQAAERFAGPLDEGRLEILNVGVAEDEGVLPFYVNEENDHWSSFIQEVGWRDGTRGHVVEVPTRPFAAVLAEYGVPHYLKIDIEKFDMLCLGALAGLDELPPYVSVESHSLDYLCMLRCLGYADFKLINQRGHNWPGFAVEGHTFPEGASGPFGEKTPGPWMPVDRVAYEWLHLTHGHPERVELGWADAEPSWFDWHARLG
jgi:FkbM family methyltransferase